MIDRVKKQISQITAQYNLKQQEESRLENEHKIIKDKQQQIEELKNKLRDTKDNLRRKQEEQKQLQKFNDFLESIVQESGNEGGGPGQGEAEKEFSDI